MDMQTMLEAGQSMGRREPLRLQLPATVTYLIGTLTAYSDTHGRDHLTDALLRRALATDLRQGPQRALTLRPVRRRSVVMHLSSHLIEQLQTEAGRRHWTVGLLVEYLAAEYLAPLSGQLARDSIHAGLAEEPK